MEFYDKGGLHRIMIMVYICADAAMLSDNSYEL